MANQRTMQYLFYSTVNTLTAVFCQQRSFLEVKMEALEHNMLSVSYFITSHLI